MYLSLKVLLSLLYWINLLGDGDCGVFKVGTSREYLTIIRQLEANFVVLFKGTF